MSAEEAENHAARIYAYFPVANLSWSNLNEPVREWYREVATQVADAYYVAR